MSDAGMSNVELLPLWKKNATAAERLHELALLAAKRPEQFDKFVVIYAECRPDKLHYRYENGPDTTTHDCMALCQAGAVHIFTSSQRKAE